MSVDLCRRRILVVEDDYLLAMGIIDEIEDHNGIVAGHGMTLAAGIRMLDTELPDACILNIRLGPDMVYTLADKLLERRIPFIFASGETRDSIPDRFANVPLHTKPIEMINAAATLMQNGVSQGI